MGRIPEDTVEQVLASADIVSLIGERVTLKRVGSRYRGLCPFHNEKTASFYVDANRQRYHCFGCGADGSAAGWLMNFENRSFPEAIKLLATSAGIAIEEREESPEERRARANREAALGALAAASQFFARRLEEEPNANHARAYLDKRAINRETAEAWDFGHAPEDSRAFLTWAKSQQLTGRALVDSGLASLRDEDNPRAGLYARFRDRLMFPIRDGNARIVGFSGRVLDPEAKTAKYVNTPETPYFKKGNLLFGLDKARRAIISAKRAILCEGQLDCIALHKAGLEESVAPLGTATTPEHAKQLARLADTVVILFDGDAAGLKAALRSAEVLLPANLTIRVVTLPPGEDPDSYLQSHGRETLDALLDQAPEFFEHLFTASASRFDLESPDGRQQFAAAMVEGLQLVPDPVVLESLILRTAGRLGVPDEEIRQRIEDARQQTRRRASRPSPPPRQDSPDSSAAQTPPRPRFQRPEHPLLRHLSLLLLLPECRRALLLRRDALAALLEQLPSSQLPTQLIEAEFNPAESSSLNRALSQLPNGAESWLNRELAATPLARADSELQAKLAAEVIARLEHHTLKRQLKALTSQLKGGSSEPEAVFSVQKELAGIRNRLAQIQSSGLLE